MQGKVGHEKTKIKGDTPKRKKESYLLESMVAVGILENKYHQSSKRKPQTRSTRGGVCVGVVVVGHSALDSNVGRTNYLRIT